jgi:hypothetical protein
MFMDALQLVSDAQAFGAAAVSTNSIDLGNSVPKREIGTGEPMGFGFQIDVGATVAAPIVEIISATDAGLTAGIISHASMTIALASAIAGALFFLGLPMGLPTQRYLGIRVTTAGGTITATSWLCPASMFSIAARHYAKSYTV